MEYFDSNEYALAPGTIVGCAIVAQERAVLQQRHRALEPDEGVRRLLEGDEEADAGAR